MIREGKVLAIEWAKNVMNDGAVFLDTETTGLEKDAGIVEVAILDKEGQVLLDTLVNPLKSVPERVSRIHGITDDMVNRFPTLPEIMPKIEEALRDKVCVVYQKDFDIPLLKNGGFNSDVCASIECAMRMYAQFYGKWDKRWREWKWRSLSKAVADCNIKLNSFHRAAADCRAVIKVVSYMAEYEISV